MDSKNISDAIKEEICERNLSAYALGKMTGVSAVTIQRFLTGERGLALATAEKLARALGLKVCRCEAADAAPEDPDCETDDSRHEGLQLFDLDHGGRLRIGDDLAIDLVGINRGSARFKIHCPPEVKISRGELSESRGVGVEKR
jgi:transcriptional regulator with XRE-family HTH domain